MLLRTRLPIDTFFSFIFVFDLKALHIELMWFMSLEHQLSQPFNAAV